MGVLNDKGVAGAITTRTGFFLPTFAAWRLASLGGGKCLSVCADLGYGVLDALVETSAYVISCSKVSPVVTFIDLLQCIEKHDALLRELNDHAARTYTADARLFASLPGTPLAYWAPAQVLASFQRCSPFEPTRDMVKRGVATGDNDRFLRLFWEVRPNAIGRSNRWIWYAKGGEYSPYFISTHLLLDWQDDGYALKNFTDETGRLRSRPQNLEFFFRLGLAYASRTTSAFGPRILPAEHGFDQTSNPIFLNGPVSPLVALVILMSRPVQAFIELAVGSGDTSQSGTAARDYTNGLIGTVPVPNLSDNDIEVLERMSTELVEYARKDSIFDETAIEFCGIYSVSYTSMRQRATNAVRERVHRKIQMLRTSYESDVTVTKAYEVSAESELFLNRFVGRHPWSYRNNVKAGNPTSTVPVRQETKKCFWADREIETRSHRTQTDPEIIANQPELLKMMVDESLVVEAQTIISYSCGVSFGRWDVRSTLEKAEALKLPPPLGCLPPCPPGMLQGPDGLPANPEDVPPDYPIRIDWAGILVDDPGHEDDIVRRVRDVLEVIWKDRAEAIEKEACEILGVRELRDYFRKPGNGGFWMDHVRRYSKSRRKAPIYWYLRSARGNYGLWLYYHRLDKDILFKALINYVEPKLSLVNS